MLPVANTACCGIEYCDAINCCCGGVGILCPFLGDLTNLIWAISLSEQSHFEGMRGFDESIQRAHFELSIISSVSTARAVASFALYGFFQKKVFLVMGGFAIPPIIATKFARIVTVNKTFQIFSDYGTGYNPIFVRLVRLIETIAVNSMPMVSLMKHHFDRSIRQEWLKPVSCSMRAYHTRPIGNQEREFLLREEIYATNMTLLGQVIQLVTLIALTLLFSDISQFERASVSSSCFVLLTIPIAVLFRQNIKNMIVYHRHVRPTIAPAQGLDPAHMV